MVVTHQGWWQMALEHCREKGYEAELKDLRIPDNIPPPDFSKMYGFRGSQRPFLEMALTQNRSGLIGAPTRWGKTALIKNTLRAYPTLPTAVVAPGKDLLRQLVQDVKDAVKDSGREVKLIGGGSTVKFQSPEVNVVSADSLDKIRWDDIRLGLFDETHALVTESRIDFFADMQQVRRIGFGATMDLRYDKRDSALLGLFGPPLANRTYLEGVREKMVEQIYVAMITRPLPDLPGRNRDQAYKALLWENEWMGRCCRWLAHELIPKNWQTLFFIKTEDQANYLLDYIGRDTAVAMAKSLSTKARDALTEEIRRNRLKRVICSDIYVQGVTFHDLMCLVNAGGGGASTTTIQKPGRLAEIRPGKRGAILFDFLFSCSGSAGPGVQQMVRDSNARMARYLQTGYIVKVLHPKEVADWFAASDITAPS
jgi:superfamily II DNA or RNA helicase